MRIVGLDTSTLAASVALVDSSRLIAGCIIDNPVSHSLKVVPMIDFLLAQVGLKLREIDGFCVAAGPGSFTGLRIGFSIMRGLSMATAKPLAGVSTLEAMARALRLADKQICPVIDAKKGQVYCALFHNDSGLAVRVTQDMVLTPEALCALIKEPTVLSGDGVGKYRQIFESRLGELAVFHEEKHGASIAAQVAYLGAEALHNRQPTKEPLPLYVRPSEAEARERRNFRR